MLRHFCIVAPLLTAALAAPAAAKEAVPLTPFDSPIRFTPNTPARLDGSHPLAARVEVLPVVAIPDKIGGFLNTFVRSKEVNQAIGETLAKAGMQIPVGQPAPFRLTVTWLSFEAPFKISFSSDASVSMRYELQRVDNGIVIFRRDVTTSTKASGGNATIRQRNVARAAVAANIAGGFWCLQEAAFGRAPENCAVSPVGSFEAPIIVAVPIYRN